jgi:hypothetical protein
MRPSYFWTSPKHVSFGQHGTETMLSFYPFATLLVFLSIALCLNLASATDGEAGPPKEKQIRQAPRENPSKTDQRREVPPPKKKNATPAVKSPAQHPAPSTQHPALTSQHPAPSTQQRSSSTRHSKNPRQPSARKYHGTFVEFLKNAPFPLFRKDADPNFFDFVDPKTGERFRATRNGERLSEKDHYRDSSVLFHVPKQFNPNKPFSYVVFFHGNGTEVRQCVQDYQLADQIDVSGKNVILVLPQLAKNAADSNPGNFARKGVFKAFMQEAAQVLSAKLGKTHRQQLEQAPIILSAFSGGYKPLACTLDRGGIDSRIKGALLLDALYEDLYIFGNWLLNNANRTFFINIYTEGSSCEERTSVLAQFLREHHLRFGEQWPKGIKKGMICFVRSPHDHLQIPVAGPPREPLAELLRSLKY